MTKQELRLFQAQLKTTNQTVALKKEYSKKLFVKTGFLVDNFLSRPRKKQPKSQILLDVAEIRVSDSFQNLRQWNAENPDIYSNLVDAAEFPPSLVLSKSSIIKTGRSLFFSKNWRREVDRKGLWNCWLWISEHFINDQQTASVKAETAAVWKCSTIYG